MHVIRWIPRGHFWLLVAVISWVASSGCSTSLSWFYDEAGSRIYQGTRVDLELLASTPTYFAKGDAARRSILAGFALLWVVDLPLSLAADTVMLPAALIHELLEEDESESETVPASSTEEDHETS